MKVSQNVRFKNSAKGSKDGRSEIKTKVSLAKYMLKFVKCEWAKKQQKRKTQIFWRMKMKETKLERKKKYQDDLRCCAVCVFS